jgi:tetratricopeptide (TPR) repeat protein
MSDKDEEIIVQEDDSNESDSDSDGGGDLILLAKLSNVQLRTSTQAEANQRRLRQEQERARKAQKEEQGTRERQTQVKANQEKHRRSKADKRLAFTLEAVKAADSHEVSSTPPIVPSPATNPIPENSESKAPLPTDLKALLAMGYALSQERQSAKAVPVLKQVLDQAKAQNNLQVALSSCSLLANELLFLEQTRDSIDYFHRAIQLAKSVGVSTEQQQSLIGALQNAYKNVGDMESARQVPVMYGPQFFSGTATPTAPTISTVTSNPAKELSPELSKAVDNALEQAIITKDLEPLKLLLTTFTATPFGDALVKHAHPKTKITCLHVASGRDDVSMIRQLVSGTADGASLLQFKDASGATPLLWAARFGGIQALDELVKLGAKFDEDLSETEIASWPPSVKKRVASLINT